MDDLRRQIVLPFLILAVIFGAGILGFMYFDRFSFLEAVYMVVITLTTVGFRPVKDLSPAGMIFDILFVLVGVGAIVFVVGQAISFIVGGELSGVNRRRRMERDIKQMKGHYLISGYGRVGRQVARELTAEGISVGVIDDKPENIKDLLEHGFPFVEGIASRDEVLEKAGVRVAKGLIACSDSDTENVFITLTARSLSPDIYIVARAGQPETEEKLKKAGANRVISPYLIAGRRMASLISHPVAVEFLDTVMHSKDVELWMRELPIDERSPLRGLTIDDADIRRRCGALVLTIKKKDGTFNLAPGASTLIEAGDTLVALGTTEQLAALEKATCLI